MRLAYAGAPTTFESIEPATQDARRSQRFSMYRADYRRGSASDWWPVLDAALSQIAIECGEEGWDGEGSVPVTANTLEMTRRVASSLIALLPSGIPPPSVVPVADGDISLSWDEEIDRYFVLSISASGEIIFTMRFGMEGGQHGWRQLDASDLRQFQAPLEDVARFIRHLHRDPSQ